MTDCILVTTTIDSQTAVEALADTVIRERLGACAQVVGPIRSTYWWHGAQETATEWRCEIKTTVACFSRLAERIRQLHSYERPEIVATPIADGDPGYLAWIRSEVRPA